MVISERMRLFDDCGILLSSISNSCVVFIVELNRYTSIVNPNDLDLIGYFESKFQ